MRPQSYEGISYNPTTGLFIGVRGKPVGFADKSGDGYIKVTVRKKDVLAHRLAWRIHYGEWPNGELDHINRDRTDNRIENLRAVDRVENCRNASGRGGVIGIKGVQQNKGCTPRPYQATIGVKGEVLRLGTFATLREAAEARYTAELLYGFPISASEAKRFLEGDKHASC